MYISILIIFLLISIALIFIIVIQEWNGNSITSGYQSINSTALILSSNLYNTKTKITVILAALFFIFSLVLGNLSSNDNIIKSKWDNIANDVDIKKNFLNKKTNNTSQHINDIPH